MAPVFIGPRGEYTFIVLLNGNVAKHPSQYTYLYLQMCVLHLTSFSFAVGNVNMQNWSKC